MSGVPTKPAPLVDPDFVKRMEFELRSNTAKKGDWRRWKPTKFEILSEVEHHFKKLRKALHSSPKLSEDDQQRVAEYAADLANYAMKIASQWGISKPPRPNIGDTTVGSDGYTWIYEEDGWHRMDEVIQRTATSG